MALLLRSMCRQGIAANNSGLLAQKWAPMATQTAYAKDMEEFWSKNRRLRRPLSPHLSIYAPQLTSLGSLCHRATGIAMAVTITSAAITLGVVPVDFTTILNFVKDLQLPAICIIGAKYVLAFPITYHYINGMRHLAWDWAWGFDIDTTYKSAYFVFAMTFIMCSYLVFGK